MSNRGRAAMTHEVFLERLHAVHGDRFKALTEKRPLEKMTVLCNWCGNTSVVVPNNLLIGQGCRYCAGNVAKTHEQYVTELQAKGILHRPIAQYAGANTPIPHICGGCGSEWCVSPWQVVKRGINCSGCKRSAKDYTLDGKAIRVRGYEHHALDYLRAKHPQAQFTTDQSRDTPNLWYKFQGKWRWTKPDIAILNRQRFFEVKSPGTFGITYPIRSGSHAGYTLFCRLRARMQQLSKYEVLLFAGDGTRMILPRQWHEWNFSELREHMHSRYGLLQ